MPGLTRFTLHLASSSMNKYDEIRSIMEGHNIDLRIANIKGEEIQTFSVLKVAERAAETIAQNFQSPLIVEDTGLYVHSLYGFPASYASFVYGTLGPGGILKLLEGREDMTAEFHSAIVYAEGGKILKRFVGISEGKISKEIRGSQGFGFDPIFIPEGSERTFAEMTRTEKNLISHRSKSSKILAEWISGRRAR